MVTWSYLAPFLRYGNVLTENCEFFLPHSLGVNPFEFLDELFYRDNQWSFRKIGTMGTLVGPNGRSSRPEEPRAAVAGFLGRGERAPPRQLRGLGGV